MRPLPANGMDIVRPRMNRISRRAVIAAVTAVLLLSAIVAFVTLARIGNQGVSVDRSAVVTDVVSRGDLERSISASGALASEAVRIVATTESGVVERVFVKPGTYVNVGMPIAQLSSPDLEADVVGARSAVEVALAQLRSVREEARATALAHESAYSSARAQAALDRESYATTQALLSQGFVADEAYRVAAIKADESASEARISHSQIAVDAAEEQAKIAAAQAQLQQASAELQAKEAEVAALGVHARSAGVVQSLAVDPGARVEAGTELARIADQRDLKAVLQVPEGQVQDVTIGMPARLDTGNGVATGHVMRIAPAAQDGSVAVDVSFARELPFGARPDQNVDGSIELQTLRNVLSIARPAGAAENTTIGLYRLDRSAKLARQVQVHLGRGSNDRIQVISGLDADDTVIVSDTSAYNGTPTLRFP